MAFFCLKRAFHTKKMTKAHLGRNVPLPSSNPMSPDFRPGPIEPSRLQEHYHDTLAADILTLTYVHHPPPKKNNDIVAWDGSSPYHKNRPVVMPRGKYALKPLSDPRNHRNIPKLEGVVLHAMVKEAITNKAALLSAMMAFQCITGAKPEVRNSKTGVAPWKLREGIPIATVVYLKGAQMYRFLSVLIEIVLPRTKDWQGVKAISGDGTGNIAFGVPATTLALFPQIESHYDMFPRLTGFDIIIQTTATTNKEARLLCSGFGIPFSGLSKSK